MEKKLNNEEKSETIVTDSDKIAPRVSVSAAVARSPIGTTPQINRKQFIQNLKINGVKKENVPSHLKSFRQQFGNFYDENRVVHQNMRILNINPTQQLINLKWEESEVYQDAVNKGLNTKKTKELWNKARTQKYAEMESKFWETETGIDIRKNVEWQSNMPFNKYYNDTLKSIETIDGEQLYRQSSNDEYSAEESNQAFTQFLLSSYYEPFNIKENELPDDLEFNEELGIYTSTSLNNQMIEEAKENNKFFIETIFKQKEDKSWVKYQGIPQELKTYTDMPIDKYFERAVRQEFNIPENEKINYTKIFEILEQQGKKRNEILAQPDADKGVLKVTGALTGIGQYEEFNLQVPLVRYQLARLDPTATTLRGFELESPVAKYISRDYPTDIDQYVTIGEESLFDYKSVDNKFLNEEWFYSQYIDEKGLTSFAALIDTLTGWANKSMEDKFIESGVPFFDDEYTGITFMNLTGKQSVINDLTRAIMDMDYNLGEKFGEPIEEITETGVRTVRQFRTEQFSEKIRNKEIGEYDSMGNPIVGSASDIQLGQAAIHQAKQNQILFTINDTGDILKHVRNVQEENEIISPVLSTEGNAWYSRAWSEGISSASVMGEQLIMAGAPALITRKVNKKQGAKLATIISSAGAYGYWATYGGGEMLQSYYESLSDAEIINLSEDELRENRLIASELGFLYASVERAAAALPNIRALGGQFPKRFASALFANVRKDPTKMKMLSEGLLTLAFSYGTELGEEGVQEILQMIGVAGMDKDQRLDWNLAVQQGLQTAWDSRYAVLGLTGGVGIATTSYDIKKRNIQYNSVKDKIMESGKFSEEEARKTAYAQIGATFSTQAEQEAGVITLASDLLNQRIIDSREEAEGLARTYNDALKTGNTGLIETAEIQIRVSQIKQEIRKLASKRGVSDIESLIPSIEKLNELGRGLVIDAKNKTQTGEQAVNDFIQNLNVSAIRLSLIEDGISPRLATKASQVLTDNQASRSQLNSLFTLLSKSYNRSANRNVPDNLKYLYDKRYGYINDLTWQQLEMQDESVIDEITDFFMMDGETIELFKEGIKGNTEAQEQYNRRNAEKRDSQYRSWLERNNLVAPEKDVIAQSGDTEKITDAVLNGVVNTDGDAEFYYDDVVEKFAENNNIEGTIEQKREEFVKEYNKKIEKINNREEKIKETDPKKQQKLETLKNLKATILNSISGIRPNTKIILHKTTNAFKRATGLHYDGVYIDETGNIHIDTSRAEPEIVAHEAFHALAATVVDKDGFIETQAKEVFQQVLPHLSSANRKQVEEILKQGKYEEEGYYFEEGLSLIIEVLSKEYINLPQEQKTAIRKLLDSIIEFLGLTDYSTQIYNFGIELNTDNLTERELRKRASLLNIKGRSKMDKQQLKAAVGTRISKEELQNINALQTLAIKLNEGIIVTQKDLDFIRPNFSSMTRNQLAKRMKSLGFKNVKGTKEELIERFKTEMPDVRASKTRYMESDEFKKAFKESKLVDENDEPLILLHGTNKKFFTPLEPNDNGLIYFTDNKNIAKGYSITPHKILQQREYNPTIIPKSIRMEKPLQLYRHFTAPEKGLGLDINSLEGINVTDRMFRINGASIDENIALSVERDIGSKNITPEQRVIINNIRTLRKDRTSTQIPPFTEIIKLLKQLGYDGLLTLTSASKMEVDTGDFTQTRSRAEAIKENEFEVIPATVNANAYLVFDTDQLIDPYGIETYGRTRGAKRRYRSDAEHSLDMYDDYIDNLEFEFGIDLELPENLVSNRTEREQRYIRDFEIIAEKELSDDIVFEIIYDEGQAVVSLEHKKKFTLDEIKHIQDISDRTNMKVLIATDISDTELFKYGVSFDVDKIDDFGVKVYTPTRGRHLETLTIAELRTLAKQYNISTKADFNFLNSMEVEFRAGGKISPVAYQASLSALNPTQDELDMAALRPEDRRKLQQTGVVPEIGQEHYKTIVAKNRQKFLNTRQELINKLKTEIGTNFVPVETKGRRAAKKRKPADIRKNTEFNDFENKVKEIATQNNLIKKNVNTLNKDEQKKWYAQKISNIFAQKLSEHLRLYQLFNIDSVLAPTGQLNKAEAFKVGKRASDGDQIYGLKIKNKIYYFSRFNVRFLGKSQKVYFRTDETGEIKLDLYTAEEITNEIALTDEIFVEDYSLGLNIETAHIGLYSIYMSQRNRKPKDIEKFKRKKPTGQFNLESLDRNQLLKLGREFGLFEQDKINNIEVGELSDSALISYLNKRFLEHQQEALEFERKREIYLDTLENDYNIPRNSSVAKKLSFAELEDMHEQQRAREQEEFVEKDLEDVDDFNTYLEEIDNLKRQREQEITSRGRGISSGSVTVKDSEAVLKAYNAETVDTKEREFFEDTMEKAVEEYSIDLVNTIVQNILNDVNSDSAPFLYNPTLQLAQISIRKTQLENLIDNANLELSDLFTRRDAGLGITDTLIQEKSNQRDYLVQELTQLTQALRHVSHYWGSTGRAMSMLRSKRSQFDISLGDLVDEMEKIFNRNKKIKQPLPKEILNRVSEVISDINKIDKEIDEVTGNVIDAELAWEEGNAVKWIDRVYENKVGYKPVPTERYVSKSDIAKAKKTIQRLKLLRQGILRKITNFGYDEKNKKADGTRARKSLNPELYDAIIDLIKVNIELLKETKGKKPTVDAIYDIVKKHVSMNRREFVTLLSNRSPNNTQTAKDETKKEISRIKSLATLAEKIDRALEGLSNSKKIPTHTDPEVKTLRTLLRLYESALPACESDNDRADAILERIERIRNDVDNVIRPNIPQRERTESLINAQQELKEVIKTKNIEQEIKDLENILKEPDNSKFLTRAEAVQNIVSKKKHAKKENKQLKRLILKRNRMRREIRKEVEKLRRKNLTLIEKSLEMFWEVAGIPRALLATADFSYVLRQGLLSIFIDPRIAGKAYIEAFKSLVPSNAALIDSGIKTDPMYDEMISLGLSYSQYDGAPTEKEEQFINNLINRIPVLSTITRASERHMSTGLNIIRHDLMKNFLNSPMGENASIEAKKAYAAYINTMTGRQGFGQAEPFIRNLSQVFFSPRFTLSRMYVAPSALVKSIKHKELRRILVGQWASYATTWATCYALAYFTADEEDREQMSLNPFDSNFGYIVRGNARIDIAGGMLQPTRLFLRMLGTVGERKFDESNIGKAFAESGADATNIFYELRKFFGNKSSPSAKLIYESIFNESLAYGSKIDWDDVDKSELAYEYLTPLTIQTGIDAYKDVFSEINNTLSVGEAIAIPILESHGISVNMYENDRQASGEKFNEPNSWIRNL